jgi:hypothetical protein
MLSILVAALWAQSVHAVVRGQPLTAANVRSHQPVVRLGLNNSPCTGTHIGRGLILTAAHCVLVPRRDGQDRPNLCVFNAEDDSLGCAFGGDYEALMPQGRTAPVRTYSGGTVEVPVPDLAILRIRDDSLRRKVEALDTVALSPSDAGPLSQGATGLRIAGQGCTVYDPGLFESSGTGTLRTGPVSSLVAAGPTYRLKWKLGSSDASACQGDSGGPMYRLDEAGRMHQFGVAASIRQDRTDDGTLVSVLSFYTRVDSPETRAWIDNALH